MYKLIDNKKSAGRIAVALSAVIFGFTPVLAQMSYAGGNNGINMAFLRAFIPIPFLYLIGRKFSKHQPLSKKIVIKGLLLGGLLFGCTLFLYSSYSYIPVSIATTIHFLYPVYVILYYRIFQKQHIPKVQLAGIALAVLGATILLDWTDLHFSAFGITLALLSGILYAGYIVFLGHTVSQSVSLYSLMTVISVSGAMLTALAGTFFHSLTLSLTPTAWIQAIAAALLVSVFGCVLFQEGVRQVGDTEAAILSLLEPITSIVFGIILLKEDVTLLKIAGCILILIGLFLASSANNQKRK